MNAPADVPALPRRRINPVVRLFSSVWFGIILLTLILVYACIFSALPQVRGAMEMTEMSAFSHWLFAALVGLFCTTMIVTTWRRIRWNVTNAGVLTVHTGLLLLTGGAVWYFSTKIEGDVFLISPRIELITRDGKKIPTGDILAEKGQSWSNVMPALGGAIRIDVLATGGNGLNPVNQATLRVQVGDQPPKELVLSTTGESAKALTDRLIVRLRAFPPAREFYDNHAAALYYHKVGQPELPFKEIAGLPLHRERFNADGEGLVNRRGEPVKSQRSAPSLDFLGLSIPTGWFEHWRMPIALDVPELPFDVEVTGYLPYVGGMDEMPVEGGTEHNPAINFTLSSKGETIRRTLFAADPNRSIMSAATPFEFRWAASAEERDQILGPLVGTHELSIEVKEPAVKKTVAIRDGEVIKVEGTPYEITVDELRPDWPMMSPGFEGARSPIAQVKVTNGEKSYSRTVIQRFPQLSQDIDEKGVRHREGPYDPNLVLRYRSAANGWVMIVAGPERTDPTAEMGIFDTAGKVQRWTLAMGQPQRLEIPSLSLEMTMTGLYDKAAIVRLPIVEPVENRRPEMGRQFSAIRMKLTGRGAKSAWTQTRWCVFSPYPDMDALPLIVQSPVDGAEWELIYSRVRHDLGGQIGMKKLGVEFFPGRQNVRSWRSDFVAQVDGSDKADEGTTYTNQTYSFGRWSLFQSGASNDHWSYTVLGVGNRRGIWAMLAGCILVPAGCLYAFYVKPVIRRRKTQKALRDAEARGIPIRSGRGKRELVEAG